VPLTCPVGKCSQNHSGDAQLNAAFLALDYCLKLWCAAKKFSGSMQAWLYFMDEIMCLGILPCWGHDIHIMQAIIKNSRFILGMRIVREKRQNKRFC